MSHRIPAVVNQRPDAPSFGALVLVPSDVVIRIVYGTIELISESGDNIASVYVEAETGLGTDIYEHIIEERISIRAAQKTRRSFTFAVSGGKRYGFMSGNAENVTETILHYSYVDL